MYRRINISLPDSTLRLIDRVAGKGERSRVIDAALKSYVRTATKKNLRKLMKEGAIRRSERDRNMAEEWFLLEEEPWQKGKR
jgi:CopG family transcriptional regulator/antitoxin EndoAI